jgi:hypothetical protein
MRVATRRTLGSPAQSVNGGRIAHQSPLRTPARSGSQQSHLPARLVRIVKLIGTVAVVFVEDLLADRDEIGVGDPGTVDPLPASRSLSSHTLAKALVDLGVPPVRNECRHASDREATVTCGDEEIGVGPHHRCSHRDCGAIRENEIRTRVPERLDQAEQIVPAAGVESGRVVSQLKRSPPSRRPPGSFR